MIQTEKNHHRASAVFFKFFGRFLESPILPGLQFYGFADTRKAWNAYMYAERCKMKIEILALGAKNIVGMP